MNNYSAQCLSVIAAVALPAVTASIYFYSAPAKRKIQHTALEPPASSTASSLQLVDNTDCLKNSKTVGSDVPSGEITPMVEFSYQRAFALLWLHFKSSYSNTNLVMWSVWWAFGTCAMGQVRQYHLFLM